MEDWSDSVNGELIPATPGTPVLMKLPLTTISHCPWFSRVTSALLYSFMQVACPLRNTLGAKTHSPVGFVLVLLEIRADTRERAQTRLACQRAQTLALDFRAPLRVTWRHTLWE